MFVFGVLLFFVAYDIFYKAAKVWEKKFSFYVAADINEVYAYLATPQLWEKWFEYGSESIIFHHLGELRGTGALQKWTNRDIEGSLSIVFHTTNKEVHYIWKENEYIVQSFFSLEADGANRTEIHWRHIHSVTKRNKSSANIKNFRNWYQLRIEKSREKLQKIFKN